ncbi:MAG: FtsX-like permease family protein [Deltaproteobacteria bacterium]|nr:FtsX-like permease family protein [Deltaproteobacteria bacterium]
MRGSMSLVLVRTALRNLVAHKAKTSIVGSIIFFGSFLVVFGTALLDSIDRGMSGSITESLAGHLQIYAKDARDKLQLFGGGFMGGDDFGAIRDFKPVREILEALPEVKAVVPLGLQMVTVMGGNEIDQTLEELRQAVKSGDDDKIHSLAVKLRAMADDLLPDLERRRHIARDKAEIENQLRDLARVRSDAFWAELAKDPERGLTFLEAHVAPLVLDGRFLYFRNVATDLTRFPRLFDRFELVDGQMVPPGEPGILLAKRTYETWVKNPVARDLDKIYQGLTTQNLSIATATELADAARRLPRQYRRISFQLAVEDARTVERELRRLLPESTGDLGALLQDFLRVDDDNAVGRYRFFYDVIAPRLPLYTVPVGSDVILRAVTKTGYFKAAKVKVWGTFRFKGLEDSDLAGASNLIDLLTFRELYGIMTDDKQRELQGIRDAVGVKDVAREDAEAALFGGDARPSSADATPGTLGAIDAVAEIAAAKAPAPAVTFTPEEVDNGLTISAAVILKDPSRLHQGLAAVQRAIDAANLNLQVVDWQTAAGIPGQLVTVMRLVLYLAIFIIFLVALVIINNAMLMAMVERIGEIGTMRAIGAQRSLVMWMFIVEILTLGAIAGTAGALAALAVVSWLGHVGIPAPNDQLQFLFSGPRLYPAAGLENLLLGCASVCLVSLGSTLYPARMATRVQPVVAMQAKE